jgi:hypothetical protein
MSQIAHEVSRRMTPEYAKERAREMARERMGRARDRAVENSWFMPLLGAGIGALVAKSLQSRAQDRGWERESTYGDDAYGGEPRRGYAPYRPAVDEEYDAYLGTGELGGFEGRTATRGATGGGTEEKAGSSMGEKATEVKERARAKAGEVTERLRDATSSVRERIPDRERIRESAREDPGLWALGAMALGALFGFAIPETRREREMLEPARRKARELGQQAKDMALEKGTQAMEKASEKIESAGGGQGEGASSAQPGGTQAAPPSPRTPTPLH